MMPEDLAGLQEMLPQLLPALVEWCNREEARILENGVALGPKSLKDASEMGVEHPERVRLLKVDKIPFPDHPMLAQAAVALGIMSGDGGMTLGYGIFIQADSWNHRWLIAHELVHVSQYEQLGSARFLEQYATDMLTVGYDQSPFELEANRKSESVPNELLQDSI